jgi:hypothetical protein
LTKLKKPCNLQCTTQSWVTQKETIGIGGGKNEYIKDLSKDCGGSKKNIISKERSLLLSQNQAKARLQASNMI